MHPRAVIRRCWSYCRTKYIVPINWDFYLRQFGVRNGIKERRYRRKEAGKRGYRPMHFRDCEERLEG